MTGESQTALFAYDKGRKLTSVVELDAFTKAASDAFDFEFTGVTEFTAYGKPDVPENFCLGLIVGASGSGKSTLLKEFGVEDEPDWNKNKAIVSHFESVAEAMKKLGAVGLNSIPSWCRPFHCLSTGEKFRALLARKIKDGAVIDEFTSVVDRNVAAASSVALRRYIDSDGIKGIVLASCHRDIIEWLRPDWVFDTDTGELSVGRFLQRPKITVEIYSAKTGAWSMFKNHHYLTDSLSKSARCFIAVWNLVVIGFASSLPMSSGWVKKAWREHRTVMLPDFQGMGIGVRFSDAVAEIHKSEGKRYYSKTAHPRMGEYRNRSPLWKATGMNGDFQSEEMLNSKSGFNRTLRVGKVCYSHEYIGDLKASVLEEKWANWKPS